VPAGRRGAAKIRGMRFGSAYLSAAVLAAALFACSSDPAPAPSGSTGGAAGSGGAPGSGGSGGSAGAEAGSAGLSGSGSTGGAAGSAGSAGSGGGGGYTEPKLLSETGLFSDVATETLAPGVREYSVAHELWSDGATKRRWVYLPEGQKIDTTNMDFWVYPVGTKLWKEFSRDGKRIETRLLEKFGDDDDDWFMMAFEWNDAGTDAVAVKDGVVNAKGTAHDVPAKLKCWDCHGNMKDRALGFSAVQLSHAGPGVTLDTLIAEDRLSAPPAAPFTLPGGEQEQKALGYFHANCGACHNDGGKSEPFVSIKLELWLHTAELDSPASTASYRTTIGASTESFKGAGGVRVVPQDLASSVLYQRFIEDPTSELHMPPLGTKVVDPAGKQIIEDWISSLTPN
jgi:hypothetical protein